jgi:hypothetical protein
MFLTTNEGKGSNAKGKWYLVLEGLLVIWRFHHEVERFSNKPDPDATAPFLNRANLA